MAKTYAYVGNWTVKSAGADGGIGIYEYDEASGALRHIETVRGDLVAGMLCIDQKRGVLYSIDEAQNHAAFGHFGGGGRVAAFRIDPASGGLTLLGKEQPSFGTLTTYVAQSGDGDFLVVANHGDKQAITKTYRGEDGAYHISTDFSTVNAALYPLETDGAIGACCDLMEFPPDLSFNPPHIACLHAVYFAPDGEHCMMSNMKQNRLMLLRVDPQKRKLVNVAHLDCTEGNWPRYGAFHPEKKLFYLNNEHALEINVVAYDPAGKLELLQTVSSEPDFFLDRTGKKPLQQTDIRISADGRFLYGACRGGGVINVYAIGEDGLLSRLQSFKLEGEAPRGMELSPDGRFLLVADPEAGSISSVCVGEDGRLKLSGILNHALQHPAPIVFYQV